MTILHVGANEAILSLGAWVSGEGGGRVSADCDAPKVLTALLCLKGKAVLEVKGASMSPFLESGDRIRVVPVALEPIQEGEILVFANSDGEIIVHRVVLRSDAGVYCKGDNFGHMDYNGLYSPAIRR